MVVGEFTHEIDLVVVGGGPGGYSAAFRASQLGVSTIIADSRPGLGGACLNAGCIPSKTLLHIAETIRLRKRAERFGVHYDAPRIELDEVRGWIEQTIDKLGQGLAAQARKHNVQCVQAHATFDDAHQMSLKGGSIPRVRFRRAVIASGVGPIAHPAFPSGDARVLSAPEALAIKSIPGRVLVVGQNTYAVELACIYEALGSKVTLLAESDSLVSYADPDLLRPLHRALERRFEAVHLSTTIAAVSSDDDALRVTIVKDDVDEPTTLAFDAAIISIGVRPVLDELAIDKAHVSVDAEGFIPVNDQMLTSNRRVFAVGDVTGHPCMADKALAQGRVAGEVAAGWNSALDALAIPFVAFTDPHLAWCGLTEVMAAERGIEVKIARIPWGASGRAIGMDAADGLTKIIYEPDTKLVLGVGIVGHGAAEMIGEGVLAVEMGVELDDLANTVHPHPSMCELLSDAAR